MSFPLPTMRRSTDAEIDAFYERVRLLAVELAGVQEDVDRLVRERQDAGASDGPLEAIMLRLSRARGRLTSTPGFDRT